MHAYMYVYIYNINIYNIFNIYIYIYILCMNRGNQCVYVLRQRQKKHKVCLMKFRIYSILNHVYIIYTCIYYIYKYVFIHLNIYKQPVVES